METPEFQKSTKIWLKSFYAFMRWFFRRFDIQIYRKRAMETLFSQLYVTGRDVPGHMIMIMRLFFAYEPSPVVFVSC